MNTTLRPVFATLSITLTASIIGLSPAWAETCIDRWSEAAPIVAAMDLVKMEELSAHAPAKLGGSIVKATLCQQNGSYIYSLLLRTDKGRLKSITVDARDPF